MKLTVCCGSFISLCASPSDVLSSDFLGTILFTRPIWRDESASICPLVRISFNADDKPVTWGKSCVAPAPGMKPRLVSGRVKVAFVAAIRKSQHKANSIPEPIT